MKSKVRAYFFLLNAVLLSFSAAVNAASPSIILDSGHDPLYPGARGSCGAFEYTYNDKIVTAISKTTSIHVLTSREAGQPPKHVKQKTDAEGLHQNQYSLKASLEARVALANSSRADLFISIHHDSVAQRFITADKRLCQGQGGMTILPDFKAKNTIGFNVFIHQDVSSHHYLASLRFAKLLGQELKAMGRKPSDYHYYPQDDCRSCRPVIPELGVWHQQLYVLRHVQMPAVLVEVGNIVDAEDEAQVNTEQFRQNFAAALNRAIERYFSAGLSD